MFAAYASGASPEDTKQDAPAAAAPAGSYATAPDMQASGDDSTKSKRAKKAAKTAKTPPPASDTAPAPKVTVLGPSSSDLDVFRVVRGPSAAGAGSLQQRALASLSKRAALGDGPAAWGIDVRPDRDNVIFGAPYKKDIPLYRRVGHGRFLLGSAGLVNLPPPPEKTTAKTDSKGGDSKAQPAVVEATVNRYFTHRLKHRKTIYIPTGRGNVRRSSDALVRPRRWDSLVNAAEQAAALETFIPISAEKSAKSAAQPAVTDAPATAAAPASFFTTFLPGSSTTAAAPAPEQAPAPGNTSPAPAQADTTDDGEGISDEQRSRQRTAEFRQRLRENPKDAACWKEFIQFQDEAVPIEIGNSHKLAAILLDRRLDLYEQALRNLPHDEHLLADYLKEAAQKLSPDELEEKWNLALHTHPHSARLWQEYLQHAVTSLSRFTVASVLAKYQRCIETLDKLRLNSLSGEATVRDRRLAAANLEATLLEIVSASAAFLAQAGFQERQTAIFQALCEVHLRLPTEFRELHVLRGQPLHFLEAFWQSNAPRFGELQAVGFATWLQHRRAGQPLPLPAAQDRVPHPPNHPAHLQGVTDWQKWLEVEWFRERRHWQAWRPGEDETEDDCDDVDRVVVFEDIQHHLFRCSHEDASVDIVLQFVDVLGASLPARVSSSHSRTLAAARRLTECDRLFDALAAGMTQLARSLQQDVDAWQQRLPGFLPAVAAPSLLVEDSADPFRPLAARVSGMAIGDVADVWGSLLPSVPLSSVLLSAASANLDSVLIEGRQGWLPQPWAAEELQDPHGRPRMALRVLEQALTELPHRLELRLAYIDVLSIVDPANARKITKNMLKQAEHRNNLRLFARYAKLEAANNKPADAFKVYVTAMQLAVSAAASGEAAADAMTKALPEVCWDFVSWLLASGLPHGPSHATAATLALVLGGKDFSELVGCDMNTATPPPSATAIARGRHALQQLPSTWQAGLVSGTAPASMLATVSCSLLAALLLDGASALFDQLADAARRMYTEAVDQVRNAAGTPDSRLLARLELQHEQLVTRWLRLLLWQAGHQQRLRQVHIPPARVRRALITALTAFPYNPEFLTCWLLTEGRAQLASHVHDFFGRLLSQSPHRDQPVLWLFAVASEILRPAGASAHRVRRLFQRAEQTRAARCPLLWRMYMEFERAQSGLEGLTKARAIFYRALQHCPGSKVLYLDAARHTPRQLQEVLDILQEKELHLRAPLEEMELIEAEVEEAQQQQQRRG